MEITEVGEEAWEHKSSVIFVGEMQQEDEESVQRRRDDLRRWIGELSESEMREVLVGIAEGQPALMYSIYLALTAGKLDASAQISNDEESLDCGKIKEECDVDTMLMTAKDQQTEPEDHSDDHNCTLDEADAFTNEPDLLFTSNVGDNLTGHAGKPATVEKGDCLAEKSPTIQGNDGQTIILPTKKAAGCSSQKGDHIRRLGDTSGDSAGNKQAHSRGKSFACSVCSKLFSAGCNLRRHMLIHTGVKPFACTFCDKSFNQKVTLKTHLRLHTGDKPFECSFCNKYFTASSHLGRHKRIHHEDKCLHDNDNLNAFLPNEGGDKSSPCSICGKCFPGKSNLKQHIRAHFNEFVCSFCGKCFSQRQHLNMHVRSHTGDKPFSCSFCDKSFAAPGNLKAHTRIHTGDKPYLCSFCGKCFAQGQQLKVHLRTHTGDKPFVCSVCGKCYLSTAGLKYHMRTHKRMNNVT